MNFTAFELLKYLFGNLNLIYFSWFSKESFVEKSLYLLYSNLDLICEIYHLTYYLA